MPESDGGVLRWETAGASSEGDDPVLEILDNGTVPIAADGSWEITFTVPSPLPYDAYGIWSLRCLDADGEQTFAYTPRVFDVVEPDEPPTTRPPGTFPPSTSLPDPDLPVGTPAPPVAGEPGFTG